jgi:hypothetical protein
MCKGVPEMYFSSEDEDSLMEWFSKLAAASNAPDNSELDLQLKFIVSQQADSALVILGKYYRIFI